jgi:pilus assembly protein CpaE
MGPENRTKPQEPGKIPGQGSLSLITICADEEFAGRLRRFVAVGDVAQIQAELQHYLSGESDTGLIDHLGEKHPDICIIDMDRDREKAIHTAERIRDTLAETALFAASSDSKPDLILQAMRAGCTEFLVKPVTRDQLLEAFARVSGRKKEAQETMNGKILAFVGAKGGAGVTSLAIHLGALLAQRHGRKTLLIDLHPDLGDVALYLRQDRHQYSFYDLSENTHRLDSSLLEGFVVHHRSGMDILPAPEGIEPARHVSGEAVKRTLEILRQSYQYILADCPPGLADVNQAALDEADQLYLVATSEVPALRNVARYTDYFSRFTYPAERLRVVINRYSKGDAINDAQIEKTLRRPIFWKVPNQYREVVKVINTGSPLELDSRSEFMQSMIGWAETLAGKPVPAKKGSKGFKGLWGG